VRGEGGICGTVARRFHETLPIDAGSLAPRDIVARRLTARSKRSGAQCVFLISPITGGILARSVPNIYGDLFAFWDRHDEAADSGRAGRATINAVESKQRRQRRDQSGGYIRNWRSWLHRIARRESSGEQSLLEGLVVAHRACQANARERRPSHSTPPISVAGMANRGTLQNVDELVVIYHKLGRIRRLMWDYVGIVRTDKRLRGRRRACAICSLRSGNFTGNFNVSVDLLELAPIWPRCGSDCQFGIES